MTNTTRQGEGNPSAPVLLMAMELGRNQWQLGFTIGLGQRPRRRIVRTDEWQRLALEIAAAKTRFGLAADVAVLSCYEAGRDGFWIHRYLTSIGVRNLVVDSTSIEVDRKARRAKTDRLDVEKLVAQLARYAGGETKALRVVRVPTDVDEHRRQLHRELRALTTDQRRVMNRIGGLLVTQGIRLKVRLDFGRRLPTMRQWDGAPLALALRSRLEREWQKVELLTTHIKSLERTRTEAVRTSADETVGLVRQLTELRGVGDASAWLFVMELFAWRQFTNRRQVGAVTGLTPTPYRSGTLDWERGISKAGNRLVRAIAVQIAWAWLRYQPESALSRWYGDRFAGAGPRARKIGIVAVARRLLIDLWRYLDAGVVPPGAVFKSARPHPRAA